jgi:hypothetical protein
LRNLVGLGKIVFLLSLAVLRIIQCWTWVTSTISILYSLVWCKKACASQDHKIGSSCVVELFGLWHIIFTRLPHTSNVANWGTMVMMKDLKFTMLGKVQWYFGYASIHCFVLKYPH